MEANEPQPIGPLTAQILGIYTRMSPLDARFGYEMFAALTAAIQQLENRLGAMELAAELRAALNPDNPNR